MPDSPITGGTERERGNAFSSAFILEADDIGGSRCTNQADCQRERMP